MSGVQEAFIASAVAITAAMVVTGIEKTLLNSRYKQVEELAQAVDALYDAGAGEEYLRELVESSQQNQAHTADLKNAMVNDLKTMLENLGSAIATSVQAAIAEQTVKQEETNQKLVTALTDGMQPAINRMEEAVQQLAGQQGAGVEKFIDAAIEGAKEQFGSQLKSFGDSLNTASLLLAENMPKITEAGSNMQLAGEKMNSAGSTIEGAGNSTAKNISEAGLRFSETSKELDTTAQSIIRAQSGISELVQAASEAASKLSAVQDIFEKLGKTVIDLGDKTNQGSTQYQQGASDLAALQQPIQDAVNTLSSVAQSLTSGIVEPIQTALDEMKRVVISGADKINIAGGTLQNAAETAAANITTAGQSLSKDLNGSASGIQQAAQQFNQSATNWQGISSQIVTVAQSLDKSSGNMKDAASTVQDYLSQYEQQNSNVSGLIKQVSDMVTQAKAQGDLGQQQVRQMTELVSQMQQAQQEAAKFGEQVGDALAKGYSSFANETKQSIQQITRDHQDILNKAVSSIGDKIGELDDTLDKIIQMAKPGA
jgi:ABC-type transporter Mla subunit MlaD